MEYSEQNADYMATSDQLPQQPNSTPAYFEHRGEQQGPSTAPRSSRHTPRLPLSESAVPNEAQVNRTNGPTPYQTPPPGSYVPGAPPPGSYTPGTPPPGNGYKGNLSKLLSIVLAALIIGGLIGWLVADNLISPNGEAGSLLGQTSIERVAAKFHTSVVEISSQTNQGSSLGSGVIIDKRGYIITNNHVITGSQNIKVILYDDTRLSAQLTGTDPTDDLAVIKIDPPAHMSVAQIGDSSNLEVGQTVLAIGNPLGITQTVTSGIVSALGRNVSEGDGNMIIGAIQTDAAINPGNSGGALVNMQSDLIGIPTLVPIDPEFKTPATGVGFAIPSNRIKHIAPQLINSGRVTNSGRAALGVQVISVDEVIAAQAQLAVNHGALIVSIEPNSAASQGGLRKGDVIVQINQHQIGGIIDLQDALIDKSPGDIVSVHIYRGNQQLTDKVKLGELQIS